MNTKLFIKLTVSAVVAGFMAFAAPAQAAIVGLTSLTGTDSFDWSQLGGPGTSLPSPQGVTSTLGNTALVSSVGNILNINQQGGGWSGNFANGANLLWTTPGGGPDLTFSLTNPVGSIGAQIQADYFGAFTAQITAYNNLNQVLGSFSENGNSTSNGDNSAIFIGVSDSIADISKVQFVLTSASSNPQDFAIGSLITGGSVVSSVPLPAGMPMFVFALLSVFGAVQFSRKRNFA